MNLSYLTNQYLEDTVVVIGDLHINSSLSLEFEEGRLKALAKSVKSNLRDSILVFAGDTFDRNTPSLLDIKLFYDLIEDLSCIDATYVINGNHDETTFEFLPEVGFKYIRTPTVLNDRLMLVPYTHLQSLALHLQENNYEDLALISHARCTIEPYIKEEVSIELLSKSFKEVILGDIHTQPKLPFKNVTYTTSPSSVSFVGVKRDTHGYLRYHMNSCFVEFCPINIPSRQLIICKTFEEAQRHLKLTAGTSYKKLRFKGTEKEVIELNKLNQKFVIKDFVVDQGVIGVDVPDEAEKLTDFLSSKVSLSEFAFNFFREVLRIKEGPVEDIRQQYEILRTSKGAHK